MNAIIWLGTLVVLFFTFIFITPVKPPAAINLPEPMIIDKRIKNVEASAPKEVVVAQAPAAPVEYPMNHVDIEKGKEIYLSTCIKCHNKDPNIKGAIGPEVTDAPLEIMQAKVATGRYPEVLPEGFVPKRTTKQMIKQPQVLADVPSIHAYVQSLKKK